jgi:deoxyribonuclease V
MNNTPGLSWNITLDEAKKLQNSLAQKIKLCQLPSKIRRVAGFDVSYLKEENMLIAGMVIIDYPSLNFCDSFVITDQVNFPYIPGYLSFREAPVLLKLIEKHSHLADIFIFDGHGIAHPRGIGIASHIGVLTNMPSIGCAKKKLVGDYDLPDISKGSATDLILNSKIIGKVLQTKHKTKPVFVSVGHLVSLNEATQFILDCTGKYRLPEPTRLAHNTVYNYRKSLINLNKVNSK